MGEFDNAVLTEIRGPGALDRNGDPGVGPVLWTGRGSGYLKREKRSVLSNGANVRKIVDVFTILDMEGGAHVLATVGAVGSDWEAAIVTIDDVRVPDAPVTRTFTVNGLEHRAAGTIVDSVRLELEGGTPS